MANYTFGKYIRKNKTWNVGTMGDGIYVSRINAIKTFVTHIKYNKVSKYIGIFSTIEEASNCYIQEKKKQLIELAIKYKESLSINSYNALLNYKVIV